MKALFPISLSNQDFSSRRIAPALEYVFLRHEHVVFLVADRLQIYNKVLRVYDDVSLSDLIRDFRQNAHYKEERQKWVERLLRAQGIEGTGTLWEVQGIDVLADEQCFRIFRNVMLSYYALPAFRQDVNSAARAHAASRHSRFPIEAKFELSKGYILEEVALSVRLHACDSIHYEYYVGGQSQVILKLYDGRYGLSPFDLAELEPRDQEFCFFSLDSSSNAPLWVRDQVAELPV
jgi:hypothetical protein